MTNVIAESIALQPAIKIERLTRRFKSRWPLYQPMLPPPVLDALDLSIAPGTITGLLGSNAAGKTTLLKCALGLLRPESGICTLLGDPVANLSAYTKSRLSYVPQAITLYPWMRTRHVVDHTAAFYPRWNQTLVADLLRDWHLDPNARVGTLSAGTLQKLAIILALGSEPELLVLDEPAASLDPAARRDFLKALLDAASPAPPAADGAQPRPLRTILFSTHITSDLERVADHVALLRRGKITYHGPLDELKDSVKRVRLSAPSPFSPSFNVPGALSLRVQGSEGVVSLRNTSAEVLDDLRDRYAATVRVEDLNLEEIFLELHQPNP
jgi:ABC-2 type transport system ATP-binding protein